MITALPILIPLFIVVLLLPGLGNTRWLKSVGITGAFASFVLNVVIFINVRSGGILVMQAGGWSAPFGITIAIDLLSAVLLVFTSFTAFLVALYSLNGLPENYHKNKFFLFFHTLMMGVSGAFIAGDIFNMYVWFEVMLISSFVLITLGGRFKQLEGAVKYVTMNLMGSFFFLAAIGLIYGKTGTLNMADLSLILREHEQSFLMYSSFVLFFIAFAVKAAVFPFFFWLPSSYHTPPVAITALFAGLLTKVGVYAMIRFTTLFLLYLTPFWQNLLLIAAGSTMVIGVLTAAAQYDIRRILSFHIISQIGYMIMGLAFFSTFGIAAAVFFLIHNVLAKTGTFLAGGLIHRKTGSFHLRSIGGLFKNNPWMGLIFFLPAMSLAGLPPLSGFFGKLFLIKGGFESGNYIITAISVWVGIVTLFSMLKIWNEAFWKPKPDDAPVISYKRLKPSLIIPVGLFALATLALGLSAGWFMETLTDAAESLKNPEVYIRTVLPKTPF
jgi:multicomponent Na+:H+ antiporter subunit D